MHMLYTSLLQPFYKYELPLGKKKTPQSLVQYILNESLKRSNEVQKFVLETIKNLERYLSLLETHSNDSSVFHS